MPRLTQPKPRRAARRRAIGLIAWPPSKRVRILAFALAGAAFVIAPTSYFYAKGLPTVVEITLANWRDGALRATSSAGLAVQHISVEGRIETPGPQLLTALDLQRGLPILAFSPAAAKARLEKLPWVRDAAVERRLPDTVHVRIVEREPLALWQRHGQHVLIDRDGVEIVGADPMRFAHLPVVIGDDAPTHAAQLIALLATEPELERRVSAATRIGGRRWNLRLELNGATVDVQLPEANAGAAWSRLAELDRANKILDRNVSVIDLRLPDRLIVRVVREAPPPPPPHKGGRAKAT